MLSCSYLFPQREEAPKPSPVPVQTEQSPKKTTTSPLKPVAPPPTKVKEPDKPMTRPAETTLKPAPQPPTPPLSPALRVTEVVWTSVNLRDGPGMNYKVLGSVKKGTSLRVLEDKGHWLRVRLENGKEVWISRAATPETSQASSPSSKSPSPKRVPSKSLSPM